MPLFGFKNLELIKDLINKGHQRSIKAKKNILATLFIKGSNIAINLILVPLTINYVNPSRYGIWLTISSIIAWFSFFDIGLTQGLRNKFAEAKAKGESQILQVYVSTTYALLAIIFFCLWLVFIIVNKFINWASILNVSCILNDEITELTIIVFTYFCISFVLKIINTVLIADQLPARASFIDLTGQLFALVFIIILVKLTEGSLLRLGLAYCIAPILTLSFANCILFSGKYKNYRPKFSKVNFWYARQLFNLGLIFFVIQVAAVIQFQTANIIIARHFSTVDVTAYNVVYKYFGVLNMIFIIFLSPFWSASTEAYHKKEIIWIKNGIRKYTQLNFLLILIGLTMLFFSEKVYEFWLGEGKISIGYKLSLWGFIYFNIIIFGSKYVSFLNGINALKIQFWASIASPVVYIISALILIKYFKLGVYSVFIASVIANFNAYLLAPLQYYNIVYRNKRGIWTR